MTSMTEVQSITQAFDLIDDYNQVLLPPVDESRVGNCLAVADNGDTTTIVTVASATELLILDYDRKSSTGWVQSPLYSFPPYTYENWQISVSAIDQVLTYYSGDDLYIVALVNCPSDFGGFFTAYILRRSDGVITNLNLTTELLQEICIDCLYQLNGPYKYGLSKGPDGTVYLVNNPYLVLNGYNAYIVSLTNWSATPIVQTVGDITGCIPVGGSSTDMLAISCASDSNGTPQMAVNRYTAQTGTLTLQGTYTPSYSDNSGSYWGMSVTEWFTYNTSAETPVYFGISGGDVCWFYTPDSFATFDMGIVPPADSYNNPENPRPKFTRFSAAPDAGAGAILFATDTDNALWMLRQTGDSNTTSGYGFAMVPLGNTALAVAAPQGASDTLPSPTLGNRATAVAARAQRATPEVYLYTSDSTIVRLAQDPTTKTWFKQDVATPVPDPATAKLDNAPTYTQEFTALNVAKAPLAHAELTVRVDVPQMLVINNVAHNVGPSNPAHVTTDGFGRLTVSSIATGLASPVLTIGTTSSTATDGQPGEGPSFGSYRADLRVHQKLADNNKFNGQTLIDHHLFPDDQQDAATSFAKRLNQIAAFAVQQAGATPATPVPRGRAFSLDFTTPGKIIDHELTPDEIPALDALISRSWISSLVGDVLNWLKNAWRSFEKTYVKFEGEVMHVAFEIAGECKSFIVTLIDDAAGVIEVLLQKIDHLWGDAVHGIKTVIEYAKELFHWHDIINTKTVLKYVFQGNMTALQNSITDMQTFMDGQFASLKSTVENGFNNLQTIFAPPGTTADSGTTFNQSVPSSGSGIAKGKGPPLQAGEFNSNVNQNAVRYNYVMNKSVGAFNDALLTTTADVGVRDPQDNPMHQVVAALESLYSNIHLQHQWEQLNSTWQSVEDLSSLMDAVVYTLLTAFEDVTLLVIGAIQAVIDLVLGLVNDIITEVNTALTTAINIPIISNLYEKFADTSQMDILDVICLAMAVPITLTYKVFLGGSEASPPFTDDMVTEILNTPISWSGLFNNESATGGPPAGALGTGIPTVLAEIGELSTAIYASVDIWVDVLVGLEKCGRRLNAVNAIWQTVNWGLLVPGIAATPTEAVQDLKSVIFVCKAIGIGMNWGLLIHSKFEWGLRATKGGPYGLLALGVVQLGCGIAAAINMAEDGEPYDAWDIAAVCLTPWSDVGKPLINKVRSPNPYVAGAAIALLGLCDLAGDTACAAALYMGATSTP